MLAATTSGRAKEIVKQGVADKNGMIAFGRLCERLGKTAGVAEAQRRFTVPVELQRESGRQVDEVGETHETPGHHITGRRCP